MMCWINNKLIILNPDKYIRDHFDMNMECNFNMERFNSLREENKKLKRDLESIIRAIYSQ